MRRRALILAVALAATGCGNENNDVIVGVNPVPSPSPFVLPSPSPSPASPGLLYAMLNTSILRFANTAALTGTASPQAVISGNSTRITQLVDMELDPVGNRLYVCNAPSEILVWDNASTRTGNVPPDRIINLGVPTESVAYDSTRDVLYVGSVQGVFRVFQASTANGTLPSGLPLTGTFGGQALNPFDLKVDGTTNRLRVASCTTTLRTGGQVVATFDNAFQSTGNSTFTGLTSAVNPFATVRVNGGRLAVNDAITPFVPGIQMSTDERILIVPGDSGNPTPVATITGAAANVGAHRMDWDAPHDSLVVANSVQVLFFDRFSSLTGNIPATTARVLNLSSFNSTCTDVELDTTR